MEIQRTHIPFWLKPRLSGDSVEEELLGEINKYAKHYDKDPHDFRATIELIPDPRGKEYGHFLLPQVTYEHGKLETPPTEE